ncbi:MAG: VanZ family protein [Nitrospirales bacterium]|nr:VanZ family protein [Nitrospira sp.]MDR4502886.1 VanZ family protein [Nitrospirales bacterium]
MDGSSKKPVKRNSYDIAENAENLPPPNGHMQENDIVRLIGYWLPLLLYAGTITLFSSLSTPKIHLENFSHAFFSVPIGVFTRINDKLYHLAEYTILGLLMYRAIRATWGPQLGTAAAFTTVCAVTIFGLADEFHQMFTPLRQLEALDLMADTFGGFLGVMLWEWALSFSTIRQLEEQISMKLQALRTLTITKF